MTHTSIELKKLTPSMRKALTAIYAGKSGILDRYGKLLVAGELLSFDPSTYVRLFAWGLLKGENGRISLSPNGVMMEMQINTEKLKRKHRK